MTAASPVTPAGVARHAHSVALQWRLLLLWTAAMLVPTALLAWPFWATLAGQLDKSLHSAQWAQQLDAVVLADLASKLMDNAATLSQAGLTALVLTLLVSPLLNGAIVAAARAPQPLKLVVLLQKGLQDYGRMLRMWVWALVLMGAAGAASSGLFHLVGKFADKAVLESDVTLYSRVVLVVTALVFLLIHLTVDGGRAQLAIYPGRTSAVKAWWRACKMVKARFLQTLGFYVGFTLAGIVLAVAITALRVALPQLGAFWFLVGVLLAELTVVVLGWMRITRLVALVDLAQARRDAGL
jgi:hypothetical protein